MSTLTISGTLTLPVFEGGPNASLVLGSPVVTPSSSTGPQLTFTESSINTYEVTVAGGAFNIPFGSIASVDGLYICSEQAATVILNGGAETITLDAGGFIFLYKAGITAASITASAIDSTVTVMLAGA